MKMAQSGNRKFYIAVERLLIIAGLLLALVAFLYFEINRSGVSPSASITASPIPSFDESRAMDVYFIDVGQGDSILVRSPSGKILLVDAGTEETGIAVADQLKQIGVQAIDVLICTHAHDDHIGGMTRIIDEFPVNRAYFPKDAERSDYESVFAALDRRGVVGETLTASMDSFIPFDDALEVRVLSPFDTVYEDENEKSIVLRIGYENTSVLLTGDAGALSERLMLKAFPNQLLDSDVLKLGHHGSYSSTSEKFLHAVSPGLAIASCGKDNKYGHPDEAIVKLLAEKDIPLLTTANYGTIHVMLDGTGIRVVE